MGRRRQCGRSSTNLVGNCLQVLAELRAETRFHLPLSIGKREDCCCPSDSLICGYKIEPALQSAVVGHLFFVESKMSPCGAWSPSLQLSLPQPIYFFSSLLLTACFEVWRVHFFFFFKNFIYLFI